MRSNSLVWGLLLILIGSVLLLDILEVVAIDFWLVIGPLLLVLFGVWLLWATLWGPRQSESEQISVPLQGATRASIDIEHTRGRLWLDTGEQTTALLSGTFAGAIDRHVRYEGDTLRVALKAAESAAWFPLPWTHWRGYHWTLNLNPAIPIACKIQTGAADAHIDLRGLRVVDLVLQAGGGTVELTMPACTGHTHAVIKSTAAAISIRLPAGVAGRIHATGGLASILIDQDRFPRVNGDRYESLAYHAAAHRLDLRIETVVGTVTVR